MVKIGKYNLLTIVKKVEFGLYLDGYHAGEILLPKRDVTEDMQTGDAINVFLYFDSEDRLIATTQRVKAQAGNFACLTVIDTNRAGAFLDWGLSKDLLVPFNQQKIPMQEGSSYVVYVYQDDISERLVASSKLDRFLDIAPVNYQVGEKVDLIIAAKTDLGYKAIVNQQHWGVLFSSEVFGRLDAGKKCKGYIKRIRDDGKIDLTLTEVGYNKIDNMASRILQALHSHQGYLQLSDKSDPEQISKILKMSKGNFKKAIGLLYKQKIITIEETGIRLVES